MKRVLLLCCCVGVVCAQSDEEKAREYRNSCYNRYYMAYGTSIALKAGVRYYKDGATGSILEVIENIARGPDAGTNMMYSAIKPEAPQYNTQKERDISLFTSHNVARSINKRLQREWNPQREQIVDGIQQRMPVPSHFARSYINKQNQ